MLPFRELSPRTRLGLMGGALLALVGAEGAILWVASKHSPAPAIETRTPAPPVLPSAAPVPTTPEEIYTAPGASPPSADNPPAPAVPAPGQDMGSPPSATPPPDSSPPLHLPPAPDRPPVIAPNHPNLAVPPMPIVPSPPAPNVPVAPVPPPAGTKAPNPKLVAAARKFDEAGALLKAGNKKGALARWEEVARLAPNDLATRQNLALVYGELNQPRAALPHARAAARLAPNNPAAQFQLARLLLANKQLRPAVEPLRAVVKLAPDARDGRVLLARTLVDLKQPKGALEQWAAVANRDGHDMEAHFNAAAVANDLLHDPKEAAKWLRRAQDQNPRDPRAPMLLSQVLLSHHDAKGAATTLARAVAASPDAFELYPALSRARLAAHDRAGAIQALQSGLARVPAGAPNAAQTQGQLRLTLGQLYGAGKQPKQALAEFSRAAKLLPRDPQPRALAALAEIDQKNPTGAVKWLSEAVMLDPKDIRTRRLYAQTLAQTAQWKAADAQYESYCAQSPRDKEALAQWARVAREAKNPARAAQIWGKAAALDPKNPLVWEQLGDARLLAKDKRGALEAFQTVAKLSPRDLTRTLRVSDLQAEMKDAPGALATLESALTARPDYAPLYLLVLRAGDAAGENEAARTFIAQKLAMQPENSEALAGALGFYSDKKLPDEAHALLNDVVARNPAAKLAKDALAAHPAPTKAVG